MTEPPADPPPANSGEPNNPALPARDPRVVMLREGAQESEPNQGEEARQARARKVLGPGCPFEAIGHSKGVQYVLDASRQVRELLPQQLNRTGIASLCGEDQRWLQERFPKPSRNGVNQPNGFAADQAADAIIAACYLMGHWTPMDCIRGRGAWLGEKNELILHLGDRLLIDGREVLPGRYGKFVYPVGARMVRPWRSAVSTEPAHELLRRLGSWNMRNAKIDPRLTLGLIAAAMIGGALAFRPHGFVTGEQQTGKSMFHLLLKTLLSNGDGLLRATDPSAAGIWQLLQYASLPVALDEFENEADSAKVQALVKLMRHATTGGLVVRGGQQHGGIAFTVQSVFICSGITMPPLAPQDRSRFLQIDLLPFTPTEPFTINRLLDLGRQMLRRLIDHWPRFHQHVLQVWRLRLEECGWDRRGGELYGTCLALADVLLNDSTLPDELETLPPLLEETRNRFAADRAPEWRRCLDFLLASLVDPFRRGERRGVGSLILQGAGYGDGSETVPGEEDATQRDERLASYDAYRLANDKARLARNDLAGIGLRIEHHPETRERVLAVAHQHPGLAEIFRPTHWASLPGSVGAWRSTLLRAPGAVARADSTRFKGVSSRALLLPLALVLEGLVEGAPPEPSLFNPPSPEPPADPPHEREPGEEG